MFLLAILFSAACMAATANGNYAYSVSRTFVPNELYHRAVNTANLMPASQQVNKPQVVPTTTSTPVVPKLNIVLPNTHLPSFQKPLPSAIQPPSWNQAPPSPSTVGPAPTVPKWSDAFYYYQGPSRFHTHELNLGARPLNNFAYSANSIQPQSSPKVVYIDNHDNSKIEVPTKSTVSVPTTKVVPTTTTTTTTVKPVTEVTSHAPEKLVTPSTPQLTNNRDSFQFNRNNVIINPQKEVFSSTTTTPTAAPVNGLVLPGRPNLTPWYHGFGK